jgi:hypothetical protein
MCWAIDSGPDAAMLTTTARPSVAFHIQNMNSPVINKTEISATHTVQTRAVASVAD